LLESYLENGATASAGKKQTLGPGKTFIPVRAYWRLCRFSTDENNLHGNGKLLCVCNFVSMASRPPLCSPALPSASCVTVRPPGPHLPDLHPLRLLLLLPRAFFESPTVPNAMQCNAVFFFRDFYL
jgi:hypothetical protein